MITKSIQTDLVYRGKEVSLYIQRIRETSTRGWLTLRASLTDGWAIRRGSGPLVEASTVSRRLFHARIPHQRMP
jgi:hypothetical protein